LLVSILFAAGLEPLPLPHQPISPLYRSRLRLAIRLHRWTCRLSLALRLSGAMTTPRRTVFALSMAAGDRRSSRRDQISVRYSLSLDAILLFAISIQG
jgi:hypothetical protein